MTIPDEDLEITVYPLQRRGGQQVGCQTGIMVVHRPTGLAVVYENERSQFKNKAAAITRLRGLLSAMEGAREARVHLSNGEISDMHLHAEFLAECLLGPVLRCFWCDNTRQSGVGTPCTVCAVGDK